MTVLSVSRKWKISSEGPGEGGEEEAKRKKQLRYLSEYLIYFNFLEMIPWLSIFHLLKLVWNSSRKIVTPAAAQGKIPRTLWRSRGEKKRNQSLWWMSQFGLWNLKLHSSEFISFSTQGSRLLHCPQRTGHKNKINMNQTSSWGVKPASWLGNTVTWKKS